MNENFLALMGQSLAALAAVLALFAALIWIIKQFQNRAQGKQGNQPIKVTQRIALDNKHTLIAINYEGHAYLIGLSPDAIHTIHSPSTVTQPHHTTDALETTHHGEENQP